MRTHRGTIAMTKYIVIVTAIFVLGSAYAVAHKPSKTYWANVGPTWDRMLNPDTYNDRTSTSN